MPMLFTRRSFLTTSLLALPAMSLAFKSEQNWPQFRGPGGQGIAEGFPTRANWNVDAAAGKLDGLLWRAEVPASVIPVRSFGKTRFIWRPLCRNPANHRCASV